VALYYFDLREGDNLFPDEEGIELAGVDAAQQEAVCTIAEMARNAIRRYPDGGGHLMGIEVRDDNGPVLQVQLNWTIARHRQS
jgi:hypothetical protein